MGLSPHFECYALLAGEVNSHQKCIDLGMFHRLCMQYRKRMGTFGKIKHSVSLAVPMVTSTGQTPTVKHL